MNNAQLTEVSSKTLQGISVRTNNAVELQGQGKIAALWGQFSARHPHAASVLAVYHNYQSDAMGDYDLTLVNEATTSEGETPVQLQAGTYLRFDSADSRPEAVVALWQKIWHYFSVSNATARRYQSDFEHYHAAGVSIYIGVK